MTRLHMCYLLSNEYSASGQVVCRGTCVIAGRVIHICEYCEQKVKYGNVICVCATTSVVEKMNTDPKEFINNVAAFIECYLPNTDEYVYPIHE